MNNHGKLILGGAEFDFEIISRAWKTQVEISDFVHFIVSLSSSIIAIKGACPAEDGNKYSFGGSGKRNGGLGNYSGRAKTKSLPNVGNVSNDAKFTNRGKAEKRPFRHRSGSDENTDTQSPTKKRRSHQRSSAPLAPTIFDSPPSAARRSSRLAAKVPLPVRECSEDNSDVEEEWEWEEEWEEEEVVVEDEKEESKEAASVVKVSKKSGETESWRRPSTIGHDLDEWKKKTNTVLGKGKKVAPSKCLFDLYVYDVQPHWI